MGTITNYVRWATNTDELKKNLADGLNQIEATRAGAEKLVQSFSGDKLAQTAHRWAAAITEVGGVTKLTASEQDRANAIFQKFIEKQTALGKAIPDVVRGLSDQITALVAARDATQKHADAADQAGTKHSKLGEILRLNIPIIQGVSAKFTENIAVLGALGGVVAGVAVGYELFKRAIEITSEVAENAKSLRNLSTETGINVEQLQALGVATKDYGVTTEELGRGIYQLSQRIAGGDGSASAAMELLNLSMRDLKKQAPDQIFLTVLDAANKLPDPLTRATVLGELFGTRFAQALLKIGPGLTDLVQKAKDSGEIMSGDAVAGAARFSDSLDHLGTRAKALAGDAMAPLLDWTSRLIDAWREGPSAMGAFLSHAPQPKPPSAGGPITIAQAAASATPLDEGPIRIGSPGVFDPQAAAQFEAMQTRLANLRKEIIPLTAAQNEWLASMAAIGPEFITTARLVGTGISPEQVQAWKESIALQQQLMRARAEAAKVNAQAEAEETDGLENAVSTRIAALDAEHQARIRDIQLEVESDQKKRAQLQAENLTYQAQRRLLAAQGTAAVEEVERSSAEEIAKIQASNRTKSLAEQLAAIDDEVYAQQQAALKKIGYTDDEWKAEDAIYQAGEARKQKLIDDANKRETDAERKLRAEIDGLQLESDQAGIARTIARIDAEQKARVAALDTEVLTTEEHDAQLALINEAFDIKRKNARLAFQREIDSGILATEQQTEDARINLLMSGMQAELAINDTKHARRLAQLQLEGKDTADALAAENDLYNAQAALIVAKYDPIHKASLALNTDLRQMWADTWAQALDRETSFADALLSPFKQIEKEWMQLIGALLADWEGQFLSKLGFSFPGVGGPRMGGGGGAGGILGSLLGGGGASAGGDVFGVYGADAASEFVGESAGAGAGGLFGLGGGLLGLGTGALSAGATFGLSMAVPFIAKGISALFHLGGPSRQEVEGRSVESQFEQSLASSGIGGYGLARSMSGLQQKYVQAGLSSDDAAKQAQTDFGALFAAEKQGGAAVQAVIDGINNRLDEEKKKLDAATAAAKQQETDVANGVDGITRAAQQFGGVVPKQFRDAITQLAQMKGLTDQEKDSLLALTKDVKPNFQQLEQTASTYGITLAGLGPKFEQANIEGRAKKIHDDFSALTDVGGDVGGILFGMRDEIGQLVKDSEQFGVAIPDNMKPLIDELIRSGNLVDSDGKKITDLGKLTFENTPIDDSFTNLEKAIEDLTKALTGPHGAKDAVEQVGKAADDLPDNPFAKWRMPDPNTGFPDIETAGPSYVSTGGIVTPHGIRAFAHPAAYFGDGGLVSFVPRGTDVRPAMLTDGELVLTAAQQGRVGAALRGEGAGATVTNNYINAIDALSFQQVLKRNGKAVTDLVAERTYRNVDSAKTKMRAALNVRP